MDDILKDFLLESYENLDRLDQDFVALETNPTAQDKLGSIFRTIHTIKGTCGFLAFGPTDFTGVAELGIIAGMGMLLALICTLTVLPALLRLLSKGSPHAEVALPGSIKC